MPPRTARAFIWLDERSPLLVVQVSLIVVELVSMTDMPENGCIAIICPVNSSYSISETSLADKPSEVPHVLRMVPSICI